MKEKEDVLRFKVTVPPVYTELYDVMNKAGAYYRSKRLVQLALLGLSVEKGQLTTTSISTNTAESTHPNNEPAKDTQRRYVIPENAAALIGDMLESL
ncbi:MAG TPA: hypothetical protein PLU16_07700 [Gallionellaceae bacterium]|nr:MAG: hypothetical protein B7Y04_03760 [Gallionellales bacterium 24-53-125]HQS58738.1 hypothetical protein [Gallionellaceae bacterium]HQS75078.1 hypothetical protein [Gallionellaceae bacterium]